MPMSVIDLSRKIAESREARVAHLAEQMESAWLDADTCDPEDLWAAMGRIVENVASTDLDIDVIQVALRIAEAAIDAAGRDIAAMKKLLGKAEHNPQPGDGT
jgi:hypothetical protein